MPLKEKVFRELRCELTPDEVTERATSCAEKVAELDKLEEERKGSARDFTSDIKRTNLEIRLLSRNVRERAEERNVECELWLRPESGRAELVRTDTGEVISSRAMTEAERQGNLFPMNAAGDYRS